MTVTGSVGPFACLIVLAPDSVLLGRIQSSRDDILCIYFLDLEFGVSGVACIISS